MEPTKTVYRARYYDCPPILALAGAGGAPIDLEDVQAENPEEAAKLATVQLDDKDVFAGVQPEEGYEMVVEVRCPEQIPAAVPSWLPYVVHKRVVVERKARGVNQIPPWSKVLKMVRGEGSGYVSIFEQAPSDARKMTAEEQRWYTTLAPIQAAIEILASGWYRVGELKLGIEYSTMVDLMNRLGALVLAEQLEREKVLASSVGTLHGVRFYGAQSTDNDRPPHNMTDEGDGPAYQICHYVPDPRLQAAQGLEKTRREEYTVSKKWSDEPPWSPSNKLGTAST